MRRHRIDRDALHPHAPYPNFTASAGLALLSVHQIGNHGGNGLRGRRASGQAQIHFHEFPQRARLLQQRGHADRRDDFVFLRPFHVNPLQQLVDRDGISHGGHIAGDRAIAQRDQQVGALPNLLQLVQVVL